MFLKKHKVLIFVFSEEKHIKGSSLKTRPFYRNNTNNLIINTLKKKQFLLNDILYGYKLTPFKKYSKSVKLQQVFVSFCFVKEC